MAVTALEFSRNGHGDCYDVQIPVIVSEKRYAVDAIVEDNWDAVSLTFNLTARDFGKSEDPIPINGQTTSAVTSNFSIGATFCGTGSTLLVLTHGIIESKPYVFVRYLPR